jgi:hypothetical protein
MLKKIGLPIIALAGIMAFGAPRAAQARVRFGVAIGGPVYAAPAAPYPYPYAYGPYPDPYYAPAYVAPAPYVDPYFAIGVGIGGGGYYGGYGRGYEGHGYGRAFRGGGHEGGFRGGSHSGGHRR